MHMLPAHICSLHIYPGHNWWVVLERLSHDTCVAGGSGARILQRLVLHSNAIGPAGATALAKALDSGAQHAGLRELDVRISHVLLGVC
jgi:hypothetical protein